MFREHLKSLVAHVEGAYSAIVMGFDGIAIDSFEANADIVDLPTLLVEYSAVTQQLRQLNQSMPEIGDLSELTVARDQVTCILKPLSEDYFLAMAVSTATILGKARFYMGLHAPALLKELS